MAAKTFASSEIRNVALVGHGGCGKTSLAEAMLFLSGTSKRLGKVDEETSILDYEPEEHARRGSIATGLAWLEHNKHKINVLDTPGDQNFIYDSFNALAGADAAVLVVSAPDGIEVQTQQVYNEIQRRGLPCTVFINKMDRERADADNCIAEAEELLGRKAIPLQVPIGSEQDFRGIVSLFQKKALIFNPNGTGKVEKTDIPTELQDAFETAWEVLVEAVAESDEELLEEYLETFELSDEQVRQGLHNAMKAGTIMPLVFGAATSCIGAAAILDLITWAFPSPFERGHIEGQQNGDPAEIPCSESGPFVAQVIHTNVDEFSGKMSVFRIFSGSIPSAHIVANTAQNSPERLGSVFALRGKEREVVTNAVAGDILAVPKLKVTHTGDTLTTPKTNAIVDPVPYPAPMMAYVIRPTSKGDADKIKTGLERILEEDPTLSVETESLTQQLVLQGMGQAHLDMAVARMKRKYKVSVQTDLPPVPYRETLRVRVENIEGKHKKQTGGAGQFGVAYMNVIPQPRDSGFSFVDLIKGGSIPRQFIPAVEKGIVERMKRGFLAGYPIIDIKIELVDGKHHPVDSKDVAFQMAGSKGLKTAFEKGGTVLLEPMMNMDIVVPTEVMGDIMGDMTSRRGRVQGMEPKGKNTIIKAVCPLVEVQRYAPDLKGMSGGKGSFTMQISGYEEVPQHLLSKVVAASPFSQEDGVH